MVKARVAAAALLLAGLAGAAEVRAQAPPLRLAELQFDIVGVRLVVDPPALTVPRNIPTQINTALELPPNLGAESREAIETLTAGALIEAELRGPDLPATRIVTRPGQPIPIPALAVPGDYFLDGIRLARNGQTVLDATALDGRPAATIPIRVISEVFVTTVTSRPLSLDEIRGRGIVIDQTNFRAVSFQVAFNIDGVPFTIDVPAALPTPEFLRQRPTRDQVVEQLSAVNQRLRATETQLPPQFDRPGLNFSIAALPFFPVDEDGAIPDLGIPPITGLVVIPGNVAFLNQFFSVLLMVTNVAPDGTTLELRDAAATIVLPTGLDRQAGTAAAPGDDPLRLARIEGIGTQPTVQVVQLGPDGLRNTADDVAVIPAQRSGEGEFLVEGLKEGSHVFDLEIQATLFGLPSGPVRLTGLAAGAVFVRNPTFSVTLAHPRTIRSGEQYDLYATVTNTSQTAAQLVTVGLEPRAITGAQLLSDAAVTFDTVAPGQAVTARFRLLAQKTGHVTFSSFTGEAGTGGGIQLSTGVDERGVPLAPNAIVLPKTTEHLPPALVAAAQRVLGQAFSIATAPAESIPAGALFVRRQTVIDRGVELAQAGERVGFGEPLARVVQDLLLDWIGNSTFDAGFDQILRTTGAGTAFLDEIAAVLQIDVGGPSVLAFQADLARLGAGRAPHLSAVAGRAAGPAPLLTLSRSLGGAVGESGEGPERSLVGAAALQLANAAGPSRVAVVARPEPDRYRLRVDAVAAGTYDLGVVIPGTSAGTLVQLRYAGIQLDAGGTAYVEVDLTAGAAAPALAVDRDGDGRLEGPAPAQPLTLAAPPPSVVAVRQLASAYRETAGDVEDPATYGLVVAVLFDAPVLPPSAELKTNYTIESNAVIGAKAQAGGRLAYLYLERPIGALVARSLTVADIADARGNLMASSTHPILPAVSDGARVFGQVRTADGLGVPLSVLKLSVTVGTKTFDVSTIRTDGNGSFDFDFVPRVGALSLRAQHPLSQEIVTLSARIRGQGEQLLLNPTFQGRGTVRGRVLAADGVTPVPAAPVALFPGSVLGNTGFETRSNALGEFTFGEVPVGVFTISAADAAGGFGQTTGVIPRASEAATVDVVLSSRADDGGRIVGRVFHSDGATPGAGFTVYAGSYDRASGRLQALDRTTTDASGTFAFARRLPRGGYDVVAVDPGTQQIGIAAVNLAARQTASVSIVLEALGSVEGVVFNAQGRPQPGAVVAGGLALVETDANGFFRLTGVPAGRRTLEAGDPVTRRRGSAIVTVLPGQTVAAAITLEARATITGRVLDANGTPVPRASVRLPALGGYTFVFANDSGVFRFPDMPLGEYLIQAPGPTRESLIEFLRANGYDPRIAFTAGDIPPELGGDSTPSYGSRNSVLAAYEAAVRTFLSVDESLLSGLPMASLGGFGWTKVQLFQDSTTIASDVRFLAQGTVAGRTEDALGRPIGAVTRITALGVGKSGFPTVVELGRGTTDAATGAFSFAAVPRFDLTTFQRAGVRGGDFALEAVHPFSPSRAQHRGQLTTTTPNLADVALRFPSATETNGTVRGRVLLPGGAPAPASTQIHISFGDLTVLTAADGRFESLLPIPAGTYYVTATAPGGLRGQAVAVVPAGGSVDITVQLLGLGATTITVRRTDGQAVPGALVSLERGTFPNDRLDGTADANGRLRFVNLSEGIFSVTAEEPVTGLSGRASGTIVRDADVAAAVVITAAGRVIGTFLSADGTTPIPFAQVVLTTGDVRAFTATNAAGRFELLAVPVGRFTVEASDPLTGRLGRGAGELFVEGQSVDVAVLQIPRGVVRGLVVQADGTTAVPAAVVKIRSGGAIRTELQATARDDGSFRFEGIPAGELILEAEDPLGGFAGTATAVLTNENEVVERIVQLAPFGSIQVSVRDTAGAVAPNASVTIRRGELSRTAAVDTQGQATFEFLPLGAYTVVARSLANPGDGGESTAVVSAGVSTDVAVAFRGAGTVTVTVVAADGVSPVSSASVVLEASASTAGVPGALATTLNGFTNGSGVVTFQNVPVGSFFASGAAPPLGGVASGVLAGPGQTAPLTIRLGASGAILGRVLLPDAITPAAQAIVTLRFSPQAGQTSVLQVTTGLTGTFAFTGIPIGAFTLSAFEVVSNGVRTRAGALSANGQQEQVGDLVLDNAAPRVAAVTPADRTAGVARQPAITVTFSEPMRSSTFTATPVILLMDGPTPVPLAPLTFSPDSSAVTLRPAQALRSSAAYTLIVRGGQDGPRDEAADLPLLDPFVSTFITVDDVPPMVVTVGPAPGERQVQREAGVRVAFSEAIAVGTVTLRDAAGAAVAGETALAAGSTVLVFSPAHLLRANTTYVATVAGVADLAANPMTGGEFSVSFATIDTIAPRITALDVAGPARAGATLSLTPVFDSGTSADVRRVEYLVGGATSAASSTAPFTLAVAVPAGSSELVVHAAALDEFGNRSATFTQLIPVSANVAPQLVLRTVLPLTRATQGQAIEFEAVATDDGPLARVALSAVGVAAFSETRLVPADQTTFTTRFTVTIPASAPSNGVLTVQAAAVDAADAASPVATVTLPMSDGTRPVVTIISPVSNAQIVPGESLKVTVDLTDDVGVTAVTLTCSPSLSGCETRALQPPATATRQTFSVNVPTDLPAGSRVTLLVSAADAAGNATDFGRTVLVPDSVAPALLSLEPASGSPRVVPGENAALRAAFSDNIGVTAVVFQTEGAFVTAGTIPVVPAALSGESLLSFVVPGSAQNGTVITVRVRARDAAGNLSDERAIALTVGDTAAPTVVIEAPGAGSAIVPGQAVTATVRAADDTAVQRVVVSLSGVFNGGETRTLTSPAAAADLTFGFTVPAGTAAGELVLSAQAFDLAGNASAAATRTLIVTDTIAPVVRFLSPAAGVAIDPRNPVTITVEASDAVGVTQIAIGGTGAASVLEARAVTPAQPVRSETFTVTFAAPPAAGGTLSLNASARDAAGNTGTAPGMSLPVLDVVPPVVATVAPASGETNVSPSAAVVITFSEPVDAAGLPGRIGLSRAGTPIAAALVLSSGNHVATLTPSSPLPVNTVITVTVDAAVADAAGNPIGAAFVSTFRTSTPDATAPQVESIDPPDNATGVPATAPVAVTFTEPMDPLLVSPDSFRVSVAGSAVSGAFTFSEGGRVVRFTPAAPWPFEAVVVTELHGTLADLAGNPLVSASGEPLAAPLTFTFLTGNFAITSPAGTSVLENTTISLAAGASASLNVASVVFSVNGTGLAPATAAPFAVPFNVPAASATGTLAIVASARNAQNGEVARAVKTVTVVSGIRIAPAILGVPRGGTGAVRLSVAAPLPEDLAITLSALDPQVASPDAAAVILPAGQTSVVATLTACTACPWDPVPGGGAAGSTALVAASPRGTAVATISVSEPVPGREIATVAASVGASVSLPASVGHAFTAPGSTPSLDLVLLREPRGGSVPLDVSITSSNPSVATATVSPIQPGARTVRVTITAVGNGIAVFTLRAGGEAWSFTVFVGPPPPGVTPLVLSAPVGASIASPPSAGQVIVAAGRTSTVTIQLLAAAAGAPTAVTVSSSNPAVATATASDVTPGSQVTTLTITTLADGFAMLTIRAGQVVRSVGVLVGTPAADRMPIVLAGPTGVSVAALPFIGSASAQPGTTFTLGILLLAEPAAFAQTVTVTSSHPGIVSINGSATIAAGSRLAMVNLTTHGPGTAILTLEAGTLRREFSLAVGGTPGPLTTPVIVGRPVGVGVVGANGLGRVLVAPGAPVNATVGVQLLAAARGAATPVTVTSGDPSLVALAGGSTVTTQVEAGTVAIPLDLRTAGTAGAVVLRFELDGTTYELLVVVGDPPPSQIPAVTAPVIGVQIDQ